MSRSGRARSKPSGVPPAMNVSVPAAAAAVPPEQGASTATSPAPVASAAAARALATSIAEQSRKSAPGEAAGTAIP